MTFPGSRVARVVLLLAVLLLAGGGLAACSAAPEKGDCVEKSGDSYTAADCATATLRVLESFDETSGDCVPVAGVTETFSDSGPGTTLCLGPRDVDPGSAINVAQNGDCVAGVEANSDVRRIDCADPAAESVVLSRIGDAVTIATDPCASVPGTNSSYSWDLISTGDDPLAGIGDNLGVDLMFCLGPVGVDPTTSPDTAQAGDCLAETGGDAGYATVDCSAPDAAYRVVERSDGGFLPIEIACSSADGATSGIQRGGGLDGYVLCLAPN
ncbi:hypothetical protein [Pseudonocardia sp. MH-G8]|uniref:LppU/SCO3897 family protein n=1 Tax=Pseudonocardia sp. MH-G8 TaxID=1854588 RepID=UPI0011799238|nr:hypothetical protein [Pseudonocardia sp. MH-G8]